MTKGETSLDDIAHCRACKRTLKGSPFWSGQPAYLPESDAPALAHHFGGWVCSAQCEIHIFDEMKSAGVWGSVEATKKGNAYDRHETNLRENGRRR